MVKIKVQTPLISTLLYCYLLNTIWVLRDYFLYFLNKNLFVKSVSTSDWTCGFKTVLILLPKTLQGMKTILSSVKLIGHRLSESIVCGKTHWGNWNRMLCPLPITLVLSCVENVWVCAVVCYRDNVCVCGSLGWLQKWW